MMNYKKISKQMAIIGITGLVVLITALLMQNQVYALSDDVEKEADALKALYNNYDVSFVNICNACRGRSKAF